VPLTQNFIKICERTEDLKDAVEDGQTDSLRTTIDKFTAVRTSNLRYSREEITSKLRGRWMDNITNEL
jgi:hypothetical protein